MRIYVTPCGCFTDHVDVKDMVLHREMRDEYEAEAVVLASFVDAEEIPSWAKHSGYKAGGKIYEVSDEDVYRLVAGDNVLK